MSSFGPTVGFILNITIFSGFMMAIYAAVDMLVNSGMNQLIAMSLMPQDAANGFGMLVMMLAALPFIFLFFSGLNLIIEARNEVNRGV